MTQIILGGVDRSGMTGTQLADEIIGELGERLAQHRRASEHALIEYQKEN